MPAPCLQSKHLSAAIEKNNSLLLVLVVDFSAFVLVNFLINSDLELMLRIILFVFYLVTL